MPKIVRDLTYISRCGSQHHGQNLEPLGLTGRQAGSLLTICKEPGISQDQLARRVVLDKSNITRQLTFLEERGLVRRVRPQNDKRVLQLFPTEQGLELLPQIREIYRKWRIHLLQDLTEEEQEQLGELLLKVKARATEWMEEHRND